MITSDGKLSQFVWNSSSDDGKTAHSPHNPSPIPKAMASTVTILAKRIRLTKGLLLHFLAFEPKIEDEFGSKYSESCDTGPLDQVETCEERLWLEKIDEKTPAEVRRKEDAKTSALRPTDRSREPQRKHHEEDNLVKLDWMTWDAITKVDSPNQICGLTAGVIGKSSEETTEPSNSDPQAQRQSKKIAGAAAYSAQLFHDFNRKPTAQEASYDSLATGRGE
jgi:hypothetical protein